MKDDFSKRYFEKFSPNYLLDNSTFLINFFFKRFEAFIVLRGK